MSQESIQLRRISERVNRFYNRFGYRTQTKMGRQQIWVSGTRELGLNQIECRIAETARGTAIGFYAKNSWQNFLVILPFLFILALLSLNEISEISRFLSGDEAFLGYQWISLFAGDIEFHWLSYIVLLAIGSLFVLMNYFIQQIRLYNLKGKFPFFTKDAIWEPRDLSTSMINTKAAMTGFFHGWMVAIFYFGALSFGEQVLNDITLLYNISVEELKDALIEGFSLSIGLIVGLLAANKAMLIRKEYMKTDSSLKFQGGLNERRVETILFGIHASIFSAVLLISFLSVTFLKEAMFFHAFYIIFGSIIGGAVVIIIEEESPMWFGGTYGIFLFFSSLLLIFRTGNEAGLAFVVVLQIIIIPLSFLLVLNLSFEYVLKKYRIKTNDGVFSLSPLKPILTLISIRKYHKQVKIRYETKLEDEEFDYDDRILIIDPSKLRKIGDPAINLAKHYFELITWYNAQFEEQGVILPNAIEFDEWWANRTGNQTSENNKTFLKFADQLVWDTEFYPNNIDLAQYENHGKNMVLAIK
jgi:hypothetical protein